MQRYAFRELFEEHLDFIARALQRHGVVEREIDDACQEVFLIAFRRLPGFEGRSSVRTWLYGIAIRVALGMNRRVYRRVEALNASAPEPVTSSDAFETYAHKQELRLLEAALAGLAHDKREAFVLHELEGMSVNEVGLALDTAESTVRYRVLSARSEVLAYVRKHEAGFRKEAAS